MDVKRRVLESLVDGLLVSSEQDGVVLYAEVGDEDEQSALWVRIYSSAELEPSGHVEFRELVGHRVRVTVEVVPD